ncbi:hypothetical protein LPJ53_002485 [Coemansia erecta]|uniref:Ubiquitin-like protease family profile domain-containing protein n=1 Tax=Coemansia erecta TaxID=147472 RepID=A0A9W7Y384_9FUNG|nr:hypothetical protein LPJ53_002485 [Coemansia erecta]
MNRRSTISSASDTPKRKAPKTVGSNALNDSPGGGLAKRTGPKDSDLMNGTPLSFTQASEKAAQRTAKDIAAGSIDQVTEIPSDDGSADETMARGMLNKTSGTQLSPGSRGPRTPDKSTRNGTSSQSNVISVMKGFENPYVSSTSRLATLNTASLHPHLAGSGTSSAKAGILVADSPHASPTPTTRPLFGLVSSMRPKSSKVNDDDANDFVSGHHFTTNRGRKRRLPGNSVSETVSAMKGEGLFSSKSVRERLAQNSEYFFKQEKPMERQMSVPETPPSTSRVSSTCPILARVKRAPGAQTTKAKTANSTKVGLPRMIINLFGVQIGRHFHRADATQKAKPGPGLRLITKFVAQEFELTEVNDTAEPMNFKAKEVDAVDFANDNDIIIMRITPKPTIESLFGESTFDPASADPELKHIVVGCRNSSQNAMVIERVWRTYSTQIPVSELDENTFQTYRTKFLSTESIDISSDEDNVDHPRSPKHKSTPSKSSYWSSIEPATASKQSAMPSFLDPTKLDLNTRRNSSKYGLRNMKSTFMGEQSSADERDPKNCISSDEEDVESRNLRFKYRSLDQNCLFEYPPGGHKRISVTGSDICRLFPREFLNDTTIEFYMRYISENLRQSNPELYEQCYFFNTFFFRKLLHLKKSPTTGKNEDPEYLYEHMKKWTASARLFDRKYIFVPINENIHWYLVIIANPHLMLDTDGGGNSDKESTDPTKSAPAAPTAPTGDMDGKGSIDPTGLDKDDMSVVIDDPITNGAASDVVVHSATEAIDVVSDTEIALVDDRKDTVTLRDDNRAAHSPGFPPASDVIDLSSPQFNRVLSGDIKPATFSLKFKDKKTDISESKYVNPGDSACILVLDSLGGKHQSTITLIRNYMIGEAKSKSQSLSPETPRGKYAKVPFQGNMCDCGVFLLNYIEKFLEMPDEIVELAMNGVDLRTWFEPALMKEKRHDILRLASRLADEYDRRKADTKPSDSASNVCKSDVEMSDSQKSGSKSDSAVGADASADKSPILSNDDSLPNTV